MWLVCGDRPIRSCSRSWPRRDRLWDDSLRSHGAEGRLLLRAVLSKERVKVSPSLIFQRGRAEKLAPTEAARYARQNGEAPRVVAGESYGDTGR